MGLNLMGFRAHCERLGLMLLREDLVFIRNQLKTVPVHYHKSILAQYATLWAQMLGELGDITQAQNVGRRTANSWLLEVCSKKK